MTSFVYIWNLNQLKNSFLYDLDMQYITDALPEYHRRHDQKQCLEGHYTGNSE